MDRGTLYVRGEPSLYFEKSASVRGQYSIFISHQGQDSRSATLLARGISLQGIPCYVDNLDPNVDGDDPELESYLRGVIRNCRALLAVVSVNTSGSWWVPLEIGVALESEKHIGTYEINHVNLPSYLWQWPVMGGYDAGCPVGWSHSTSGCSLYSQALATNKSSAATAERYFL